MDIKQLLETEGQPVLAASSITIRVKLETGQLLTDLANAYSLESDRVMKFSSNERAQVSGETFLKYFKTLLFLRVSRVNAVENGTTKLYKQGFRRYTVPALIHVLLVSIGEAVDQDFGFRFIPEYDVPVTDLMSPEEMVELSHRLQIMNENGLVCVDTGIPMDVRGELATMATFNIESEVLSYRKDHPVYGFYAAFFKHQVMSEVLSGGILRIRYGAESDYRVYISHLFK